ncbi:hypothetical protein Taro_029981 [Colocasia esculenta]|uniref:Uncharacterized protein n=1 Tax=Colocasia esculenta TaxID=4460 RepID=A0A843VWJ1_COLES|nr:hypothetical protein [Colocasia esculenta]
MGLRLLSKRPGVHDLSGAGLHLPSRLLVPVHRTAMDHSSASGDRHLPYISVRPDPLRPNKEKVFTLLAPFVGTNERPCALLEHLIFMRPAHPYSHRGGCVEIFFSPTLKDSENKGLQSVTPVIGLHQASQRHVSEQLR